MKMLGDFRQAWKVRCSSGVRKMMVKVSEGNILNINKYIKLSYIFKAETNSYFKYNS